jgi:tetratricopeptide (TPR) repeat protein
MRGRVLMVGIAIFIVGAVGPSSAQTISDLKTCQNASGDPDQQIRACNIFLQTRRAVGGRPAPMNGLSAIASLRGGARMKKGEIDRAIADYDLGLALYPANYALYGLRGLAYHRKGDRVHAIDDYSKAIRLIKQPIVLSESLAYRGMMYMEARDYGKAMSDLNEAIRVNPKNGEAFSVRGQVFAILGDQPRAEADYRSSSKVNPKMKSSFEHFQGLNVAWLNYLKEIQDDDDFANWSSPPLDAFRRAVIGTSR